MRLVSGSLPARSGSQRTEPISMPTGKADQRTLTALSNDPCGAVGLSTPTRPTSQDWPVGAAPLSPVTRPTSQTASLSVCSTCRTVPAHDSHHAPAPNANGC
ncbi:hypothetical protein [Spirosoma horti]